MKVYFILLFIILHGPLSWSQDTLTERQMTFSVENASPEDGKRQALNKAFSQISEELGKDFLGEERFTKNRSVILSRILKSSAKYIPYSKATVIAGSTANTPTAQNIRVEMKISRSNFKQLLQDFGLLSQGEAQPVVIPYITWTDHVKSKSYRWWKDRFDLSADSLVRNERILEQGFKSSFYKSGFYSWKPLEVSLWNQLPTLFQSERLTPEDFQMLGQYFQAPLAVEGQITINKSAERADRYAIDIKWMAFLTENGKVVGDVSRQFLTEAGPEDRVVDKKIKEVLETTATDLSNQIFEAWQKGTLSAKTLRLTVRGSMGMKSQESLRQKIGSEIILVKSIRERAISKDQISYEVESPASALELAQKMNHFEFENKKYKAEVAHDSEIVLSIE